MNKSNKCGRHAYFSDAPVRKKPIELQAFPTILFEWTLNTSSYDSYVLLSLLCTQLRTNSSGYISSHSVSISSDFTPLGSIRKLEVPGLFVRRQPVIDNGPIAARLIYIPETSPKAGLGRALLTSKGLLLRNWDDMLPSLS